MVDLRSQLCTDVGEFLSAYKYKETVAIAAGLLTLPRLSANSIRCETLAHLAVAYSRGNSQPNRTTFNTALNDLLGNTKVAMLEDPQEDVFVSNILTEIGDLRVFNALWEANDYFIQVLIDIVTRYKVPDSLQQIRESCISLLKLSEEVASRSNLSRNFSENSRDKQNINVPRSSKFDSLSKRVTFTNDELENLGISVESIAPFVISNDDLVNLTQSKVGNSILERKPVVEIDGSYILTIPSAVGIAIRYYFLAGCEANSSLSVFSRLLADYQAKQLTDDILFEFKGSFKSIKPELPDIANIPSMHALLLKDNSGTYLHAVILHDKNEQIIDEGMDSYFIPSEEQIEALNQFFHAVAECCKSQDDFVSGSSLITFGGLGRGYNLGFDKWPDDWGFTALSLNDLLLLSNSKSRPLEELFECIRQKQWMEDNGVKVHNINGDMNYFGFWKQNDYKCIPDEIPVSENGFISLYTDFVFSLRRDLRIVGDKHSVKFIDGTWKRVERLTRDSFYEGMKNKPIYASVDHILSGVLNGLVESDFIYLWFGVEFENETLERSMIYEWWSGFIDSVEEALSFISSNVTIEECYSLQVLIDFSNITSTEQLNLDSQENRGYSVNWNIDVCTIQLAPNFLANFAQVDNVGEKLVLYQILYSISDYLAGKGHDIYEYIDRAIDHVLGDSGVRLLHIFMSFDQAEFLLNSESRKPIFIDKKKTTFDLIRISKSLGLYNEEYIGKRNCGAILHSLVDEIWVRISAVLSKVKKKSILNELVSLVNAIEQDRGQWNRTARAVYAIYSKHDDVIRVARDRESNRSLASLCLRSLIEMSLCECPDESEILINEAIIGDLLSLTSLLVNIASDSDAIHWGLVAPKLILNMNGTYLIPTDVMDEMLVPYYTGHFGIQFGGAIEDYEDLYDAKEIEKTDVQVGVFGEEFDNALSEEYGLLAHHIIECWSEIIDLHIESSCTSITISRDAIISHIVEKRQLETEIVVRFFRAFTLFTRSNWSNVPEGFSFRDIAPWKFKRRLSCLVKPIIQLNDEEVFLSLSLIRLGIGYFLDRAKRGEFNTEFFESTGMRTYVGSMIEKRGADFTELVASKLEADKWFVNKELLMKTVGATQELGDIDVLAIKGGVMLIFECKKLQMAKTISEIADVCNRFRGKEKDELRKHLNRVDWSLNNLNIMLQRLNYDGKVLSIRSALLTSTDMPMKYKNDLPINSKDIISYREIDNWLSTLDFPSL